MPNPSSYRRDIVSTALFCAGLALGWPLFAGAKLQGNVCDPLADEFESVRMQLVSATADGVSIIPAQGPGPIGSAYYVTAVRPEAGATGDFAKATLFEAAPTEGTGEFYRNISLQRQP
ncbi:hypothetical protein D7X55_01920 [Corallococcus sp. AB049A]|uniref:Uncharacterized protein n=1 Tax=Corallococcus interemptor TaxID=2316720 RepID=A0A3A8R284_9BACT|nr:MULTISPECIES: hypothetical protein [Corallococcus]RKH50235.1 hypothetical protein D7Y23_13925 [Corallococcus sp. AB050B]RKH73320.1 hypothetical protein D7X96_02670 [Corallococcus interemptor]RKI74581.1 hypothetical protein D7X55_01920 [Corallococcus sp. AB049A]